MLGTYHRSSFRPYDDPDKLKGSEVLKVLHAVGFEGQFFAVTVHQSYQTRTHAGACQA